MQLSDFERSPGYDFFDIDHTIVDGSSGLQFALTGIRRRVLSSGILLSIPRMYWQYHFGEMDLPKARRTFRELAGISKDEIDKVGEVNYENKIRGRIFADAEQLIRTLSSSGRRIAFITSSFYHVVQPLANELHVKDLMANSLIYENGITTGAVGEPFLFGEEKKNQALRFLEERGISPLNCSFYTDSANDIALLEAVGKPVAVNPGRSLRTIALNRHWQIVEFSKRRYLK
jgi:putative phosphoserine phosphatase/1-acylglycerol-3-phosphate O-acyltransferase